MQQSSMVLFCEECGAANDPTASTCVACSEPLAAQSLSVPVLPVQRTAPVVREVVAGTPVETMPLNLLPGTLLFGRYQICREIGRGGFSVVYMAEDLKQKRKPVALKRIYLHTLTPRQIIDATETCNREIKMLTLLRSVPGVPHYYESFTDPENWYLIMEYIPGQTLEEYARQAPGGCLPESLVLEIGRKLANIVQNLHVSRMGKDQYIVFRDLKPSNVMITPDKELFLIDFGIARMFVPGQKRDTTPLGSPGYAPSEQYGKAQTDRRSDIYSLGMTLQTLLTGRDPLELAQGEPSLSTRRPSRMMQNLINAMQSPEMSYRPETMEVIEKRLARIQQVSLADRKRLWTSLGVGGVIGLVAVIFAFVISQHINLNSFVFTPFIWFVLLFLNLSKRLQKFRKKQAISGLWILIGFVATFLVGILLIFFYLQPF